MNPQLNNDPALAQLSSLLGRTPSALEVETFGHYTGHHRVGRYATRLLTDEMYRSVGHAEPHQILLISPSVEQYERTRRLFPAAAVFVYAKRNGHDKRRAFNANPSTDGGEYLKQWYLGEQRRRHPAFMCRSLDYTPVCDVVFSVHSDYFIGAKNIRSYLKRCYEHANHCMWFSITNFPTTLAAADYYVAQRRNLLGSWAGTALPLHTIFYEPETRMASYASKDGLYYSDFDAEDERFDGEKWYWHSANDVQKWASLGDRNFPGLIGEKVVSFSSGTRRLMTYVYEPYTLWEQVFPNRRFPQGGVHLISKYGHPNLFPINGPTYMYYSQGTSIAPNVDYDTARLAWFTSLTNRRKAETVFSIRAMGVRASDIGSTDMYFMRCMFDYIWRQQQNMAPRRTRDTVYAFASWKDLPMYKTYIASLLHSFADKDFHAFFNALINMVKTFMGYANFDRQYIVHCLRKMKEIAEAHPISCAVSAIGVWVMLFYSIGGGVVAILAAIAHALTEEAEVVAIPEPPPPYDSARLRRVSPHDLHDEIPTEGRDRVLINNHIADVIFETVSKLSCNGRVFFDANLIESGLADCIRATGRKIHGAMPHPSDECEPSMSDLLIVSLSIFVRHYDEFSYCTALCLADRRNALTKSPIGPPAYIVNPRICDMPVVCAYIPTVKGYRKYDMSELTTTCFSQIEYLEMLDFQSQKFRTVRPKTNVDPTVTKMDGAKETSPMVAQSTDANSSEASASMAEVPTTVDTSKPDAVLKQTSSDEDKFTTPRTTAVTVLTSDSYPYGAEGLPYALDAPVRFKRDTILTPTGVKFGNFELLKAECTVETRFDKLFILTEPQVLRWNLPDGGPTITLTTNLVLSVRKIPLTECSHCYYKEEKPFTGQTVRCWDHTGRVTSLTLPPDVIFKFSPSSDFDQLQALLFCPYYLFTEGCTMNCELRRLAGYECFQHEFALKQIDRERRIELKISVGAAGTGKSARIWDALFKEEGRCSVLAPTTELVKSAKTRISARKKNATIHACTYNAIRGSRADSTVLFIDEAQAYGFSALVEALDYYNNLRVLYVAGDPRQIDLTFKDSTLVVGDSLLDNEHVRRMIGSFSYSVWSKRVPHQVAQFLYMMYPDEVMFGTKCSSVLTIDPKNVDEWYNKLMGDPKRVNHVITTSNYEGQLDSKGGAYMPDAITAHKMMGTTIEIKNEARALCVVDSTRKAHTIVALTRFKVAAKGVLHVIVCDFAARRLDQVGARAVSGLNPDDTDTPRALFDEHNYVTLQNFLKFASWTTCYYNSRRFVRDCLKPCSPALLKFLRSAGAFLGNMWAHIKRFISRTYNSVTSYMRCGVAIDGYNTHLEEHNRSTTIFISSNEHVVVRHMVPTLREIYTNTIPQCPPQSAVRSEDTGSGCEELSPHQIKEETDGPDGTYNVAAWNRNLHTFNEFLQLVVLSPIIEECVKELIFYKALIALEIFQNNELLTRGIVGLLGFALDNYQEINGAFFLHLLTALMAGHLLPQKIATHMAYNAVVFLANKYIGYPRTECFAPAAWIAQNANTSGRCIFYNCHYTDEANVIASTYGLDLSNVKSWEYLAIYHSGVRTNLPASLRCVYTIDEMGQAFVSTEKCDTLTLMPSGAKMNDESFAPRFTDYFAGRFYLFPPPVVQPNLDFTGAIADYPACIVDRISLQQMCDFMSELYFCPDISTTSSGNTVESQMEHNVGCSHPIPLYTIDYEPLGKRTTKRVKAVHKSIHGVSHANGNISAYWCAYRPLHALEVPLEKSKHIMKVTQMMYHGTTTVVDKCISGVKECVAQHFHEGSAVDEPADMVIWGWAAYLLSLHRKGSLVDATLEDLYEVDPTKLLQFAKKQSKLKDTFDAWMGVLPAYAKPQGVQSTQIMPTVYLIFGRALCSAVERVIATYSKDTILLGGFPGSDTSRDSRAWNKYINAPGDKYVSTNDFEKFDVCHGPLARIIFREFNLAVFRRAGVDTHIVFALERYLDLVADQWTSYTPSLHMKLGFHFSLPSGAPQTLLFNTVVNVCLIHVGFGPATFIAAQGDDSLAIHDRPVRADKLILRDAGGYATKEAVVLHRPENVYEFCHVLFTQQSQTPNYVRYLVKFLNKEFTHDAAISDVLEYLIGWRNNVRCAIVKDNIDMCVAINAAYLRQSGVLNAAEMASQCAIWTTAIYKTSAKRLFSMLTKRVNYAAWARNPLFARNTVPESTKHAISIASKFSHTRKKRRSMSNATNQGNPTDDNKSKQSNRRGGRKPETERTTRPKSVTIRQNDTTDTVWSKAALRKLRKELARAEDLDCDASSFGENQARSSQRKAAAQASASSLNHAYAHTATDLPITRNFLEMSIQSSLSNSFNVPTNKESVLITLNPFDIQNGVKIFVNDNGDVPWILAASMPFPLDPSTYAQEGVTMFARISAVSDTVTATNANLSGTIRAYLAPTRSANLLTAAELFAATPTQWRSELIRLVDGASVLVPHFLQYTQPVAFDYGDGALFGDLLRHERLVDFLVDSDGEPTASVQFGDWDEATGALQDYSCYGYTGPFCVTMMANFTMPSVPDDASLVSCSAVVYFSDGTVVESPVAQAVQGGSFDSSYLWVGEVLGRTPENACIVFIQMYGENVTHPTDNVNMKSLTYRFRSPYPTDAIVPQPVLVLNGLTSGTQLTINAHYSISALANKQLPNENAAKASFSIEEATQTFRNMLEGGARLSSTIPSRESPAYAMSFSDFINNAARLGGKVVRATDRVLRSEPAQLALSALRRA